MRGASTANKEFGSTSQRLDSHEDWVCTVKPGDETQQGLGMPRRQALGTEQAPSEFETSQSHQREPEKT